MKKGLLALAVACSIATGAQADLGRGLDLFEQAEFPAALEELQPLADAGDATALYIIGIMYLNGFVEAPSDSAGASLIRQSAEQGHLAAQTELARMYRNGDGVPQDAAESVRWYEHAAEGGDVGAQLFVADAYMAGIGIPPDPVEAYKWYIIAIQYWGPLAERARDVAGEEMTEEQIKEATRRAEAWIAAHPDLIRE